MEMRKEKKGKYTTVTTATSTQSTSWMKVILMSIDVEREREGEKHTQSQYDNYIIDASIGNWLEKIKMQAYSLKIYAVECKHFNGYTNKKYKE